MNQKILSVDSVLAKISDIISTFKSDEYISDEKLMKMHRGLSYCHYKLTEINVKAGEDYAKIMYEFDGTAAKAKIEAEHKVKELRQTRKLLDTVKQNLIHIGRELTIIKKD